MPHDKIKQAEESECHWQWNLWAWLNLYNPAQVSVHNLAEFLNVGYAQPDLSNTVTDTLLSAGLPNAVV